MSMVFESTESFLILYNQVKRMYDHKNKTSPREVRRKAEDYKLLKSILNKLNPTDTELTALPLPLEVKFNRKELRALQSLFIAKRQLLLEVIQPGYENKFQKEVKEEEKVKLQFYVEKVQKDIDVTSAILYNIERAL